MRQSIEVLECFAKVLSPGGVLLARLWRKFELNCGRFQIRHYEIDSIGDAVTPPLNLQPARRHTCCGKLFNGGKSDNVFGQQLLQARVAVMVELCCNRDPNVSPSPLSLWFMTSECALGSAA